MKHELKTWPLYFRAIEMGRKKFEIRYNDRDFKVDDVVILKEWDPETETYTGAELTYRIGTMITEERWGLKPGYCVFSLCRKNK